MKRHQIIQHLLFGVITLIALFFLSKLYYWHQNEIKVASVSIQSSIRETFFSRFLINSANWINDFWHFNALRNKVINLEQANNDLLAQNLNCQELNNENISLAKALKVKQEANWHLVPAQVVLMDPTGLSGRFWINKGQQDGLKVGMNIISADKILLGVVTECEDHYSQVESIFAPQIKIGVEDLNSNVLAVLEKDQEGKYILTLVPQGAKINIGDVLITSAENTNFLKGLLVAQIKELIPSSNVLQEYLAEPLLNSHQLSQVFVITDFIPQNAAFH